MSKTWSKTTDDRVPDSGVGEVVNVDVDDDILMAQGHRPAMKRTFNLLSTLGLGFRQVTLGHPSLGALFSCLLLSKNES